jgi:hypothetical protein
LARIFRDICQTDVEADGLLFKTETVRAQPIRDASVYAGIRITMEARLENARIPIQVDIGFGDVKPYTLNHWVVGSIPTRCMPFLDTWPSLTFVP